MPELIFDLLTPSVSWESRFFFVSKNTWEFEGEAVEVLHIPQVWDFPTNMGELKCLRILLLFCYLPVICCLFL